MHFHSAYLSLVSFASGNYITQRGRLAFLPFTNFYSFSVQLVLSPIFISLKPVLIQLFAFFAMYSDRLVAIVALVFGASSVVALPLESETVPLHSTPVQARDLMEGGTGIADGVAAIIRGAFAIFGNGQSGTLPLPPPPPPPPSSTGTSTSLSTTGTTGSTTGSTTGTSLTTTH
ncbi:hypothetical protein HGRIS_008621 [Hohenbuehelia grisea]|uniref:Uncharacterized protein n=1 Tax=Hohenbuehelia grisea TaxID=104357 RepID=A0ABR3J8J9_9AGAR